VTVYELRKKCEALNISTKGSKAVLAKRLEDHAKASSAKEQEESESNPDAKCDAILLSRSEIGDDEGMKRDAKTALEQALEDDELHVEDAGGELWVGNRRGLDIVARMRALEEKATKLASLEDEITSHRTKIDSLEDRVTSLTSSLEAYPFVRRGFGLPRPHHSKSI
jgi:chromosome segregation ATPase